MSTVQVGRMAVEVTGEGFPVVMVHGLGGTSNGFQPQMPALEGYRVLRPDLPGAGRSPVPHEEISIEWLAAGLVAALRTLGVGHAHFVGHSMGTILCQRIAADEPGLVASLTLFGAIIEPPDGARTGLAARARTARAEGMDGIADQIVANTLSAATRGSQPTTVALVRELIMRQDPQGYARHCEALGKARAVDARLISAPTLLITGDADPVAPPGMAQMLADRIKGASLSLIDRCGHWAMLERPAECNEKMVNFLKRVP